jgi:hypothetical protein
MDGTPKSILPDDLNARLGAASAPAVFDVRRRMSFDAPDVASVDTWALALSLAAAIAIFRFLIGMMPTLVACCAAGVVLFLLGATA